MTNTKLLIPFICLLLSGCSSTEMTLKKLNQDIPSVLVDQYNSSTEPYVDTGEYFNLLLLMLGDDHVSKTQSGFEAYTSGCLGLIVINAASHAKYDEDGSLKYYTKDADILTPIIFSYSRTKKITNETIRVGHSWSFLSFGYKEKITGKKYVSALWIPIPINRINSKEITDQNQSIEPIVTTPVD